ncbi:MAG: hypothetical protein R3B06_17890 [Kofleriaceae bacterium]
MRRAAALAAAAAAVAGCKGDDRKAIGRSDRQAPAVTVVDQGGPVERQRTPEVEPNGDAATAQPLGDGVRGTLDGAADVDVYAFDSAGSRMLAATLTGVAGLDLKLELRDAAFAPVVAADRGGAGVAEALPNVPLDQGRFYLVVRELEHLPKVKKGQPKPASRTGPSPAYELVATQVTDPPPGGEREPDDDPGSANEVVLSTPVTGYLGWAGDVDVWKLTIDGLADGDGLDVAVTAVPKVALTVEVLDAGSRRVMRQSGAPGQPVTLRSLAPRVAPGEPTVHYVAVSGKPANPDQTYQLTVATRLLDLDEEAEPNDRDDRANPLRFGGEDQGTMRGTLGPGEVDRFVLSPGPGPMTLDVALDPPPGVTVDVVASGGATAGSQRVGERVLLTAAVAPGQAVILKVAGAAAKAGVAGPYQLRWSLSAPSAPDPVDDPGDDPLPPEE